MDDHADDLFAEAMALVAEEGWERFGLTDLARRTGKRLAEVQAVMPSREHLLHRLSTRLDRAMLDVAATSLDELDPRERIFDLVMRRMDAAKPYRAAMIRMRNASRRDPALQRAALCGVDRASRLLLDASRAGFRGLQACAARQLLSLLLLRVGQVWLDDDTDDLGRTMAELDKRLGQLQQLARWSGRRRRRDHTVPPAPEPSAATG